MVSRVIRQLAAVGALGIFAGVSPAQSGFITRLDQIQVQGQTNWEQAFGPSGTGILGGSYASIIGLTNTSLSVWGPPTTFGSFGRLNQGFGATGSFAPGTPLLFSGQSGLGQPEWRMEFRNSTTGESVPLAAFALQYEFDRFGPFTVDLRVYNSQGGLLGVQSYSGVSSPANDGSALWVGYKSDFRDIGYFTLTNTTVNPLNNGSLVGPVFVQADLSPVPEPASAATLGFATAVFAASRVSMRRKQPASEQTA